MRYLPIVCLVLALIACKKKTPPADPTPEPVVCKTGQNHFEGVYVFASGNQDTIKVVFLHNNCPAENQNTYVVYGLGHTLNSDLKGGGTYTYSLAPDTVIAFENDPRAITKNHLVQFKPQASPKGLVIDAYYINESAYNTGYRWVR